MGAVEGGNMQNTAILIRQALAEDAVERDLTALATIEADQTGVATLTVRQRGVLSGTGIAHGVFHAVDAQLEQDWHVDDGSVVQAGQIIGTIIGSIRSLLAAERTALNFLQHLSGIATATDALVRAVEDTDCVIVDTRKTVPGLRYLEKKAVVHGGGVNHRMDLAGGMLIKENHIAAAGSISRAVEACRAMHAKVWIEVECETMAEVREAVDSAPDMILLDNMDVQAVRQARGLVPASITLEASGGMTLANARAYAETGVDRLAIGAITHSAPVLDVSMRVEPE